MNRLLYLLIGLLTAGTLSLAGCGGGGGGGGTTGGTAGGGNGGGQAPVASLIFNMLELTGLGGDFSAAVAINDDGAAVGISDDGTSIKAARWTVGEAPSAATELSPLAGNSYSAAYGINNLNIAVGESGATIDAIADATTLAVYWPAGSSSPTPLSTFGLFPGGGSSAYGINEQGEIVGEAVNDAEGNTVAVYWTNTAADPVILANLAPAGFGSAYFINADSLIVGESRNNDGMTQAVVWELDAGGNYQAPLALDTVAGQVGSVAFGADLDGHIVGEVELDSGEVRGLVWNSDGAVEATLGEDTSAMAINNGSRIAGATAAATGSDRASLWDGGNPGDQKDLAEAFSQAYDINDSMHLVGIRDGEAFAATPQQD